MLTEIIANALDSGASCIALHADPAAATLTAVDDGQGMSRAELRRFHDVAATAKARGEGIGFAGVAVEPSQAQAFVGEFLARWGESTDRRGRMRSKRKKRANA